MVNKVVLMEWSQEELKKYVFSCIDKMESLFEETKELYEELVEQKALSSNLDESLHFRYADNLDKGMRLMSDGIMVICEYFKLHTEENDEESGEWLSFISTTYEDTFFELIHNDPNELIPDESVDDEGVDEWKTQEEN